MLKSQCNLTAHIDQVKDKLFLIVHKKNIY